MDNYPEKLTNGLKVTPLLSRDVKAQKRKFNVNNGSAFSPGSDIRIPITGQMLLQSGSVQLNITLNIATAGAIMDVSPFSLFDQIRVEATGAGGSNLLEQCEDPGVFYAFLSQYTMTEEDMRLQNAKMGSYAEAPTLAFAAAGLKKSGLNMAVGSYTLSLDLSQVLGLFTQDIPLYNTTGMVINLRLAPQGTAIQGGATTTHTITQPYITATCIEGGEAYEKSLNSVKTGNGEVSLMFNTYSRYIQNTSAALNSGQLLITESSKSCLGFFAISRTTSDITNIASYKNGNSGWTAYSNHIYNINGVQYPTNPINNAQESVDEVLDLFSNISRNKSRGVIVGSSQAYPAIAFTAVEAGPSSVLAVNLAKCPPDMWGCGYNLSNSQAVNLQVSYAPAAAVATTVTIFALRQQKVHIAANGEFSVER